MEVNRNDEAMQLFFETSRLIIKHAKACGRNDRSIFNGQFRCLFILNEIDEISQSKLSGLMNIRPTSLSEMLRKLEDKGYVVRIPSTEDKRTFVVSLTKVGKAEVAKIHDEIIEKHGDLKLPLSEADTKEFIRLLTIMKEHYTTFK
ncbi:MAG: MarR family winged helix-turn-helix transcriptional regulator [Suipraeoptans sp.]